MPTDRTRLSHLAVLRVDGPDRVDLLQGQSSNDVHRVDANRSQLTSFNGPKGRCYAVAVLAAWDDAHWLIVESSVADALAARLRRYVLRSKVTIARVDELAVVSQPRATLGADVADWQSGAGDGVLRIAIPGDRALALVPAAHAAALPDGTEAWRLADLRLGLASVQAETVEHWVPLWMGLERFGAIDYRKGCYTGQEVVARSHYLGTVKQRPFLARSPQHALPGTKVHAGGEQSLGEVAAAAADGDGWSLLIVGRAVPAGATPTLGAPDGPPLTALQDFDPAEA